MKLIKDWIANSVIEQASNIAVELSSSKGNDWNVKSRRRKREDSIKQSIENLLAGKVPSC